LENVAEKLLYPEKVNVFSESFYCVRNRAQKRRIKLRNLFILVLGIIYGNYGSGWWNRGHGMAC
jgi:hypothetical protein